MLRMVRNMLKIILKVIFILTFVGLILAQVSEFNYHSEMLNTIDCVDLMLIPLINVPSLNLLDSNLHNTFN